MADTDQSLHNADGSTPTDRNKTEFGSPTLDEDRYLSEIQVLDLKETEKRELLQAIWNILVSITELDIELDPIPILFTDSVENSSESVAGTVHCRSSSMPRSFSDAVASSKAESGQEES